MAFEYLGGTPPQQKTVLDYMRQNQQDAIAQQQANNQTAATQQQVAASKQQVGAADYKLQQQKIDGALQLLSSVNDDTTYQQAKQQAQDRYGMDVSRLPAQYDPNWVKVTQNQLLDAKDKATLAIDQQKAQTDNLYKAGELQNSSGGWDNPYIARLGNVTGTAPVSSPPTTQPMPVSQPMNQGSISIPGKPYLSPAPEIDAANEKDTLSNAMNLPQPTAAGITSLQRAPGNQYGAPPSGQSQPLPPVDANPSAQLPPKPNLSTPIQQSSSGGVPIRQPDETKEQYIARLPNGVQSQVKGMIDGSIPFPSSNALGRFPAMQKTVDAALQADPTANANRFGSMTDFTRGKSAQQVKFFSVATSHLNTLSQLVDALGNGDVKLLNKASNSFQNQFGQVAPNNFNAAKQIVADEIVKAVVGAGGTGADRDKAQQVIDAANSPAQLKGVINTYKSLMAGQLEGLKQQYENGTGRSDFYDRLAPEAKAAVQGGSAPTAGSTVSWGDL